MKYLKKFENHTQYENARQNLILPNVSLCAQENEVHYNPLPYFVKLHLNDNSTILIEGSGELTPAMIGQYTNTLVSVEIGNLCTSIADGTFYGRTNITSVTISNSVISIGNSVFTSCSSLRSINIPSSVTSIGFNVFSHCNSLSSITVDVNNTVYDSRDNCNGIINTTANTIVAGCKATIIPNSVTTIGPNAFVYCDSLTSVTIPNSVTIIESSAFQGCSGLTSVTIGSGVTSIGDSTFASCSGLTSVISLAITAPTIHGNTFRNVKTNGTLTVPIGSSGYNTWMSTSSHYLGYYNWTKVEQ